MNPIVIVGGGVIGTSVAYALRDADRDVVLFEQDSLGAGTTSDSIAMATQHQEPPDPTETRLRRRAWGFFEPLVDDGTLSYEEIGTLHTASTDAGLAELQELAVAFDDQGVRVELLDAGALDRFGLSPDAVRGALHLPEEGYLDPTELLQFFVRQSSARVETDTAVTDVHLEGGEVAAVRTTAGRVAASAVVNAAGPWAARLNDAVGVSLPMKHTYGPIVVLQADADVDLPLTMFEDGYYVRAEGANQAFAGRFAVSYEDAQSLDPDATHSVPQEFYLEVGDRLSEAVPALGDADVVADWMGLRTVTPDGRPYVGETAVPGFYVACGMSGLGITRAPVVGEVLAATLTDDTSDVERFLGHMSPSRG